MQRLQKGDLVRVISGDDKGKQGRITKILNDRNKVVVEGVNMVKRHLKATPQRPGGILEVEAPLFASKVMPVDPETNKPTRVRYGAEGDVKVRLAKSGAKIEAQR
jgi:large subunit ribosomal protein L24